MLHCEPAMRISWSSAGGQQVSRVMSGAEAQRFADSHPLRLFPTFVWRVELADNVRARGNASVLTAVEELRGALPPLKPGGGWQSRHDLHRRWPCSVHNRRHS